MVLQTSLFGKDKEIKASKKNKIKTGENYVLRSKYKELYDLYARIYETLDIDIMEQKEFIIIGKTIAYPSEHQAELLGTQFLPIDDRIEKHWEYLYGKTTRT